jgi:hypothetical protein
VFAPVKWPGSGLFGSGRRVPRSPRSVAGPPDAGVHDRGERGLGTR